MLVATACWRTGAKSLSVRDILNRARALRHRLATVGGASGVIATDPDPIGAAWRRCLPAHDPGYGFVDAQIPELSIGVVRERRGLGVGFGLLGAVITQARWEERVAVSLSVEAEDPARRLYRRVRLRAGWRSWCVADAADAAAAGGEAGVTAGPQLRGSYVVLTPVTAEHVPDLRRILRTPEVWRRWADEAASAGWPFDDPSATRFAVLLDGLVRGMVQYAEEDEPAYRHGSIDIFLDPAVHGRGVGRDAVGTLASYLVKDRQHHRLVIDPAADNEPAIRCYAAVGFRPVGIMRRYERDADGTGWHDGLLMDLLADEIT